MRNGNILLPSEVTVFAARALEVDFDDQHEGAAVIYTLLRIRELTARKPTPERIEAVTCQISKGEILQWTRLSDVAIADALRYLHHRGYIRIVQAQVGLSEPGIFALGETRKSGEYGEWEKCWYAGPDECIDKLNAAGLSNAKPSESSPAHALADEPLSDEAVLQEAVLTGFSGRTPPPTAWLHGPLILDCELDDGAFRFFCLLRLLAGAGGTVWHSQAELAGVIGWGYRKVGEAIRDLKRVELIRVRRKQRKAASIEVRTDPDKYGDAACRFFLKLLAANARPCPNFSTPEGSENTVARTARVCGPSIVDDRLGDGEFRLLCFLRYVANRNQDLTWGQERIGEEFQLAEGTINRRISRLREIGLVLTFARTHSSNHTNVLTDPCFYGDACYEFFGNLPWKRPAGNKPGVP